MSKICINHAVFAALLSISSLIGNNNVQAFPSMVVIRQSSNSNILTQKDLLYHAKLLTQISKVTVQMFGEEWKLDDFCFKPPPTTAARGLGAFGNIIESIEEKTIPCHIMTPLDCFWDASKALGPSPPLHLPKELSLFFPSFPTGNVTFKNMNVKNLIDDINSIIPVDNIISYYQRAGIGSGYQDRPCVDPLDQECPSLVKLRSSVKCEVIDVFLKYNEGLEHPYQLKKEEISEEKDDFFEFTDVQGSNDDDYYHYYDYNASSNSNNDSTNQCKELKRSVLDTVFGNPQLISKFFPTYNQSAPDYGKILNNGCNGFAEKISHWPESLIMDQIEHFGDHIAALTLQSTFKLTDKWNMYKRIEKNKYKKPKLNISTWTSLKAMKIVNKWIKKVKIITSEIEHVTMDGFVPYKPTSQKHVNFEPFYLTFDFTHSPENQKLMHELKEEIEQNSFVIRIGPFWLYFMQTWLNQLQMKYDQAVEKNLVNETYVNPKASDDVHLAYNLICSVEHITNCSRNTHIRLIDDDGIINKDGFWNYVTAWFNLELPMVQMTEPNFVPLPPLFSFDRNQHFFVPPAKPFIHSQIPIMVFEEGEIRARKELLSISKKYWAKGLLSYSVTPFVRQIENLFYRIGNDIARASVRLARAMESDREKVLQFVNASSLRPTDH